MTKRPSFVNFTLHIVGFLLCIVPPAVATVLYFPIWNEAGSGHTLAGGGVLLCIIFAMPMLKLLRRVQSSCASYLPWLLLFLLFKCVALIAEEMVVISFMGLIGNLLGGLCFYIRHLRLKNVKDNLPETKGN